MTRALSFGCAALALAVGFSFDAAVAADEPSKQSSCAFLRTIDRWSEVDDRTIIIHASPQRRFKVTFVNKCRELKWATAARLDPSPSGAVCLSPGDVIAFKRSGNPIEERCMIQTIEPLPPPSN